MDSKAKLKYYFRLTDDRLFLDSIPVIGDLELKPIGFIKWYEEGDLDFSDCHLQPRSESPLLGIFDARPKITFEIPSK